MVPIPAGCRDQEFAGDGVALRAWRCQGAASPRGTIIYLHGIADNRSSAAGIIGRFLARGYRVIAYDSRANGQSGGTACTYGFYERKDLRRVIDAIGGGPLVLIGTSLGAAVALQEAAGDPRVTRIVAAETFADLRTIASERAPWFFTRGMIDKALALAERQAQFSVAAVSPVAAASAIRIPVLVIHGADDRDTPPAHAQRVYDALAGPKRLLLLPGTRHNESLRRPEAWQAIDQWLETK